MRYLITFSYDGESVGLYYYSDYETVHIRNEFITKENHDDVEQKFLTLVDEFLLAKNLKN